MTIFKGYSFKRMKTYFKIKQIIFFKLYLNSAQGTDA
jgi:hypothetical protein